MEKKNYFLNKLYFAKADCFFALGKFKEANDYIDKVLPDIKEHDISNAKFNPIIVLQAVKLKADVLRRLAQHEEAELYYLKTEKLADMYLTNKSIQDISDLYVGLTMNRLDMHDVHGALEYKRKHDKLFGKNHAGYQKIIFYFKNKSSDN
ncbi:hypothetical protein [Cysteiniphilum litorale]|uniref:hypothetical protein n=1 Tax=Cysteiniphilum litorale TaxID=2056700 RepID=UPI003F885D30